MYVLTSTVDKEYYSVSENGALLSMNGAVYFKNISGLINAFPGDKRVANVRFQNFGYNAFTFANIGELREHFAEWLI